MTKHFLFTMAVTLSTLTLLGCASQSKAPQGDYRLPLFNQTAERYCSASARQVVVSDLMLSDGILLQRSKTQLYAARNHRWSGSLEQQLQQSVQRELSEPNCAGKVVIEVMDFYGDVNGNAVVSGHWQYQHNGSLTEASFSYRKPLKEDGYDALVQALNDAWVQTLDDIKSAISD